MFVLLMLMLVIGDIRDKAGSNLLVARRILYYTVTSVVRIGGGGGGSVWVKWNAKGRGYPVNTCINGHEGSPHLSPILALRFF